MLARGEINENIRFAGIDRLTKRDAHLRSPAVIAGEQDYKRYKLVEAFKEIAGEDQKMEYNELLGFLTKKGKEITKNVNFQFKEEQVKNIENLFNEIDTDRSLSVDQ